MKTLLIYPPFCTPASPPYSLTNLHAFLKNNLPEGHDVLALDLNILFHKLMFSSEQEFYTSFAVKGSYDSGKYQDVTDSYRKQTRAVYSDSNKSVVDGGVPVLFKELLEVISSHRPDIAAFSIVYSSQAFYAYALIKELKQRGIRTVIGGPAVNQRLREAADASLSNELELLEYVTGKPVGHDSLDFRTVLDFSIYDLKGYFTPEPVIPIRASNTCFYQKCAFCTHHTGGVYMEFPVGNIVGSIKASTQGMKRKNIFLVDDIIPRKRLLRLAEALKPLNVRWMCQLKPTADLDESTLKTLSDSGLKIIIWGVESADDRVLEKMRKGTNIDDITKVIRASHKAGIRNVVYIMFGFPTETEQEAEETIDWLQENKRYIDLISTSIFGLQKNTPIYEHPEEFSITGIKETGRTILDHTIEYDVSEGMSHAEAKDFRKRNMHRLQKMNRFPKAMNFFREHMLCLS
jgi:radical SAM superfamily enzyme YgiQ (UPF0313 family)